MKSFFFFPCIVFVSYHFHLKCRRCSVYENPYVYFWFQLLGHWCFSLMKPLTSMSQSVLMSFSSMILMVLDMTSRSLIHSDLTFMYGIIQGLSSLFLESSWSFFPKPFVEEYFLAPFCIYFLFIKVVENKM